MQIQETNISLCAHEEEQTLSCCFIINLNVIYLYMRYVHSSIRTFNWTTAIFQVHKHQGE